MMHADTAQDFPPPAYVGAEPPAAQPMSVEPGPSNMMASTNTSTTAMDQATQSRWDPSPPSLLPFSFKDRGPAYEA